MERLTHRDRRDAIIASLDAAHSLREQGMMERSCHLLKAAILLAKDVEGCNEYDFDVSIWEDKLGRWTGADLQHQQKEAFEYYEYFRPESSSRKKENG